MEAKKREPLLRVVKHAELSKGQSVGLRILAVVLALIVGGIFIAAIGYNPFEIYATMITGCFRSPMAMQATVKFCIPMCISALGVLCAVLQRNAASAAAGGYVHRWLYRRRTVGTDSRGVP